MRAPAAPRRAQTGPVRWVGTGYVRMLFAHHALVRMQEARARVAARRTEGGR